MGLGFTWLRAWGLHDLKSKDYVVGLRVRMVSRLHGLSVAVRRSGFWVWGCFVVSARTLRTLRPLRGSMLVTQ